MKKYVVKFIDGEIKEVEALTTTVDDFGNRVLIGKKSDNVFIIGAGTFKYIEEIMENENGDSSSKTQ